MMKRTTPPARAQHLGSHRPARCYPRVVREVAGTQRAIGVGVLLVLAVVLIPGLLTAGCYYPPPTFTPPVSCDPGNDAACPPGMTCSAQGFCDGTGAGPGSEADTCFGTAPFRVCLAAAPTLPLNISQLRTINTADTADLARYCVATAPTDSPVCVLAATTITIEATLRATGPLPLVLIARDTIAIKQTGSIDVGSHRGATPELGERGAGADPLQGCSPGQPPDERGGGAGGSFLGLGGTGGPSVFMDKGGTPGSVTAANKLRGGCAGQDTPGQTATPVRGGHGGGAVLLIAGQSISVASGGAINAAGEGGEGGSVSAGGGGGGGGSGGMIVLDARMITSQGLILASGGGGGGGSGFGSTTSPGNPGADPSAVPAAAGGAGSPEGGGRGGDGSSAATAGGGNGSSGTSDGGNGRGGGGGGGAGIVKAPAALGSQVSPMPTQ
jgi:hypothetical protein